MKQFDFGANWRDFSNAALTSERVEQARTDFRELLSAVSSDLSQKSLLDIGFGQGLSLLSASEMGAAVVGCDINPTCAQVLCANRRHFPGAASDIPVVVGSILETDTVEQLRRLSPEGEGYDIVHSWGVLHHTGDMVQAIRHAASLVRPGGHLVLAIYNRHWSSPAWLTIKWAYVHFPRLLQRAMIGALYPVIYVAKWLVTHADPKQQSRGMDFYYNVIDWVGGYPYEYCTVGELAELVGALGFKVRATHPAEVPTGCNEVVFRRC